MTRDINEKKYIMIILILLNKKDREQVYEIPFQTKAAERSK